MFKKILILAARSHNGVGWEAARRYNRQFCCRRDSPDPNKFEVLHPMKRCFRSFFLSALLLASFAPLLAGQSAPTRTDDAKKAYKSAMEEADQKIADEVKSHSELMKNLEYLTTQIGPRLTGSKQMQ